jgi:hypothetical protein
MRIAFIPAFVALQLAMMAYAQAQTDDLAKRIQTGVDLIKLGCGTGQASQKTEVKGNVGGSITLAKPTDAGVAAGASVNYTKEEAQGLVAALKKEMDTNTVKLSEKQIDCMKPYLDAIFKELFPQQKSDFDRPNASLTIETSFTVCEGSRREHCPRKKFDYFVYCAEGQAFAAKKCGALYHQVRLAVTAGHKCGYSITQYTCRASSN